MIDILREKNRNQMLAILYYEEQVIKIPKSLQKDNMILKNTSKINDTTYILKIKAEVNDVNNIGYKLFHTNLKSSLN